MHNISFESLMTVTGGTGFMDHVRDGALAMGVVGLGVGSVSGAAAGAPFFGVGAIPGAFVGATLGTMGGVATGAMLGASYGIADKLGFTKNM
jgi:hypothetical protein